MWVVLGLSLICALLVLPERWGRSARRTVGRRAPLLRDTGGHWRRNYSRRSFLRLGGTGVLAGLLIYTGADEAVESFHTGTVRSPQTDRAAHVLKFFGERFWFVNWLLVAAVDAWWQSGPFSRWGRHNFEAMVVGLPVLWTVQRGLGANRPSSDEGSPRWQSMAAPNCRCNMRALALPPARPHWACRWPLMRVGINTLPACAKPSIRTELKSY